MYDIIYVYIYIYIYIMYVCIYIYTHIITYIYIYIYAHMLTYTCVHICMSQIFPLDSNVSVPTADPRDTIFSRTDGPESCMFIGLTESGSYM